MAGDITHTFTGTGFSASGDTSEGKTLVLSGGDNSFIIEAQVSYDAEVSFKTVAEFNGTGAQNFVWTGSSIIPLRFECIEFNGENIELFFK